MGLIQNNIEPLLYISNGLQDVLMSAHEQLFWRNLADNRFERFNCAFEQSGELTSHVATTLRHRLCKRQSLRLYSHRVVKSKHLHGKKENNTCFAHER